MPVPTRAQRRLRAPFFLQAAEGNVPCGSLSLESWLCHRCWTLRRESFFVPRIVVPRLRQGGFGDAFALLLPFLVMEIERAVKERVGVHPSGQPFDVLGRETYALVAFQQ